jgi:hypothetical protein
MEVLKKDFGDNLVNAKRRLKYFLISEGPEREVFILYLMTERELASETFNLIEAIENIRYICQFVL